ncbi:hypothetical protein [Riemerella anatipestifer]|uniref:Uncharacterized protein n=1 Tax=Riemerella anatipestifer (strain ATCC 11845 / DSM 15868 / JCM 9532 / NCTC 11014) TaxID=693978 RepID=E4TE55_RIEAD|nr:hypothetical protein [Riemerella anatipestifer]YP_007003676.1 hypothetical protein F372_gp78 [Riemerella phage RAP44]WGH49443.1 hypothetical protein CRP2_000002 [Riemerella phage vB_RanS_CRP2]ADQ83064.1 hypothetical protein Riean_1911 [Riemerella anatipestifer ATCC 11845 = DSM 15868]ADZ11425.1 hypothetical protein RIA_0238 [Riemerella anatipestifer RA-GD]AEB71628.1 hypothetical protein [Riemerella phage RAP44]AFD55127.1 hypothetical protein RA0C_0111 [Riemerella anatipestifer ATCC 11845 = 
MSYFLSHKTPEFLLAELPIKDGSPNDDRLWVYCVKALSLIEFINLNQIKAHGLRLADEKTYKNERWGIAFVQNNCEYLGLDESEVIKNAWKFLTDYFDWEDKNIDESSTSTLN